ncbi:MAG: hypothetical protein N3F05_02760 [Candidatus Diapherotrites archaeon]|nr:hypothetical protein [Candidatus Diapherotrites archaeon]
MPIYWDYDCYTFWYCDNTKCNKPTGCYENSGSCYTQNASKCSCKEAVKCKYNSTYNCYSFDYCDTSRCPPTGCVGAHTNCIALNERRCDCREAVNCLYNTLHDCYTFKDCNNSVCKELDCSFIYILSPRNASVKWNETLSALVILSCNKAVSSITVNAGTKSNTCYNPSGSTCKIEYTETIPQSKSIGKYYIDISGTVVKGNESKNYTGRIEYNVIEPHDCKLSYYLNSSSLKPGDYISGNATLTCYNKVDLIVITFGSSRNSCNASTCSIDHREKIPIDREPGNYTVAVYATATVAGIPKTYHETITYSVKDASLCRIHFNPLSASVKPGDILKVDADVSCSTGMDSISVSLGTSKRQCQNLSSCSATYQQKIPDSMRPGKYEILAEAAVTKEGASKKYNASFSYTVEEPPKPCSISFNPSTASVYKGSSFKVTATIGCGDIMDSIDIQFGSASNRCQKSASCSVTFEIPQSSTAGVIFVHASAKATKGGVLNTYSNIFKYTATDEPYCFITFSPSTATVVAGDILYVSAILECDTTIERLSIVFSTASNYCSNSKGCMVSITIPTRGIAPGDYTINASGSIAFSGKSKTYSSAFKYKITKPTTSAGSTATSSTSAQSTSTTFEQFIAVIRETIRFIFPFG